MSIVLGFPPYDTFDTDWDSILGAQVSAMHSSGVGLTAQGVARGHSSVGEENYQPTSEWFFVSWVPNDYFQARVGRLRSPVFMLSDTLEIGNSYPWVLPNINVYTETLASASHYDGMDVTFTKLLGNSIVSWQVVAGSTETTLGGNPTTVDNVRGTSVSAEWESLTLRYAFFGYEYTVTNTALSAARLALLDLANTFPNFGVVAEAINAKDVPTRSHELGLRYESGEFTTDFELIYSEPSGKSLNFDYVASYLSLARQRGPHTVFGVVGYSRSQDRSDLSEGLQNSKTDISPGLVPALDTLRQAVAITADQITGKLHSLTLGYRYDITESWDIKAEVQNQWFNEQRVEDSYITQPDLPEKGTIQILRLVTDWVF